MGFSRGAAALVATVALVALAMATLAGCGLTLHPGGDQLAFLRGGQIWLINPDGSLPRTLDASSVVGFAWSPNHHQVVFRAGAAAYALASALPPGATSAAPDAAADLGVSSINGGAPIQVTPVTGPMERSDAWWDPSGNRFLYREYPLTLNTPVAPLYIDSQSDQPVGIARQPLLDAAGQPTLSPDGMRAAVVDPSGALRVGAPGQVGAVVARGALLTLPAVAGVSRPARLLWQPGQNALLYATTDTTSGGVTLRLLDLGSGQSRAVLSLTSLLDVAFSPDGSLLLTHTPTGLSAWRVSSGAPVYTIAEGDPTALAWWSPDGQSLLIQEVGGLTLADGRTGAVRARLRYAAALAEPTATTLWRPGASSPWNANSGQLVFVAPRGATWQGQALPTPANHSATGLYIVAVSGGAPTLIDSHADTQPGWSYPDPATTFLMAS